MPSAEPKPIGTVTWTTARSRFTATLHADGTWTCPDDPLTAKVLRTLAEAPSGPQYGPFGPAQLKTAARILEGEFQVYPRESLPPGTVY